MKIKRNQLYLLFFACSLLLFFGIKLKAQNQNVVIVIIDGARYSETFGDPVKQYIPFMSAIAEEGSIIDEFYNNGITYTSQAIPALWCGTWTEVRDTVYNGSSTSYAVNPTLFEYFRKQTNASEIDCYYVLPYIENLWLPSFDPDYGPSYWPSFHSAGISDTDVCNHTLFVMNSIYPRLLLVYLADVDHAGHNGNWNYYTQAIKTADSIVGAIWDNIQSNQFYENNTTLIVTNDHGRHDDAHGGFSGHGCSCDGCRHIMFLAAGKNIKAGYISEQHRTIPDMAVTAGSLLNISLEKATGHVMSEIFNQSPVYPYSYNPNFNQVHQISPNPFRENVRFDFEASPNSLLKLQLFNLSGLKIKSIEQWYPSGGQGEIIWNGCDENGNEVSPGIYLYFLMINGNTQSGKIIKHLPYKNY
ncbi:MAG: alkaline phosphatase family protein [Bacteroidales bacterium]|nr:alkaline phosphatase family protein [Bacteroidales bacterium]MCF8404158.1 alkaline phosphatase family protein [Bacteroidales bacterium]